MPACCLPDLRSCIGNSHAIRHGFDHREVVFRIAEADDLVEPHAQGFRERTYARALVPAGRRDIDQRRLEAWQHEAELGHFLLQAVSERTPLLVASRYMDIGLDVAGMRVELRLDPA